ncbi:hypothetical protein FA95DRAFT_1682207 [Auriscalpium vulgare]|uniref:Uncharacterized protein n=1 Tax=Auriscalpium vulgare TaxID=40419 RepID=A0ACB8RFX5_9AGAM|nr:hypothetical protein FA95DRAFT_1682207 [Auriscalpium vulgare]
MPLGVAPNPRADAAAADEHVALGHLYDTQPLDVAHTCLPLPEILDALCTLPGGSVSRHSAAGRPLPCSKRFCAAGLKPAQGTQSTPGRSLTAHGRGTRWTLGGETHAGRVCWTSHTPAHRSPDFPTGWTSSAHSPAVLCFVLDAVYRAATLHGSSARVAQTPRTIEAGRWSRGTSFSKRTVDATYTPHRPSTSATVLDAFRCLLQGVASMLDVTYACAPLSGVSGRPGVPLRAPQCLFVQLRAPSAALPRSTAILRDSFENGGHSRLKSDAREAFDEALMPGRPRTAPRTPHRPGRPLPRFNGGRAFETNGPPIATPWLRGEKATMERAGGLQTAAREERRDGVV